VTLSLELRHRRLAGAVADCLEWRDGQFLGEDFDSPGTGMAHDPQAGDQALDVEVTLAAAASGPGGIAQGAPGEAPSRLLIMEQAMNSKAILAPRSAAFEQGWAKASATRAGSQGSL